MPKRRLKFKRSNWYKRIEESSEYKKEQKLLAKKRKEEAEEQFKNIIKSCALKNDKKNKFLLIKKGGLASFFEEVKLDTGKIHIIRGNNGQGKSTLLNNIVNSNFLGAINSISNRLKISSTDKETANYLNYNEVYSPYKMDDDNEIFPSNLKYELTNINNSITIYTDFSIGYFREKNGDVFTDISEEYNNDSNGERKIAGINSIFFNLKFILKTLIEFNKGAIDLFVVMDEPESGLSLEVQTELMKKIKRYLSLGNKSENMSLTFLISSHSFAWNKSKDIIIHNINDFKIETERKKERSKVFI
jgi:energy-coupling factor transporter ATP-binding protein EcfA2